MWEPTEYQVRLGEPGWARSGHQPCSPLQYSIPCPALPGYPPASPPFHPSHPPHQGPQKQQRHGVGDWWRGDSLHNTELPPADHTSPLSSVLEFIIPPLVKLATCLTWVVIQDQIMEGGANRTASVREGLKKKKHFVIFRSVIKVFLSSPEFCFKLSPLHSNVKNLSRCHVL